MIKSKKLFIVVTSLVILSFVITAFAQGGKTPNQTNTRQQISYVDNDKNGVCNNFGTQYQGGYGANKNYNGSNHHRWQNIGNTGNSVCDGSGIKAHQRNGNHNQYKARKNWNHKKCTY